MPNTTWKFTSPDSNSSCGCKEPAPGSKIHGFRVESIQTNNRFVNNRGVVQVKLMNCETVHKQSKHGDGGTNQTNQSIADKRNDHLLGGDLAGPSSYSSWQKCSVSESSDIRARWSAAPPPLKIADGILCLESSDGALPYRACTGQDGE